MRNIPCVILCGGKSSRMQKDKCFLEFQGKSLVRYQFDRMSQLFDIVYLSCKMDKFNGEFSELIFDTDMLGENLYSPMLALYSIFRYFEKHFVFVIPVDMPFVSKKSIQVLINECFDALVITAQSGEKHHFLCGLYHSSLAPLCLELLHKNIHKIEALSQNAQSKFVKFEDEKEWVNLNSPQDYERYKNA